MSSFKVFDSLSDLSLIIQKEKSRRVFLVTGNKSFEDSGSKSIIDSLTKGLNVLRFSDFQMNPKLEDIIRGAKLVNEFSPDLMIAIGGGSVIDTAKLISSISPDSSIAKSIIKGETEIQIRNFPLVAIPTTSGSGSECTHFAVAYIDSEKYSVANQSLLPNYIVLDERLTFSMSPNLTAVTGMDAFGQALESFWAVGANKESREYSREALEIILSIFPDVVHDPTPERRKLMLKASHLAGKAINISKTTGPHAFSYILTMLYGLPHGHAVGLTLAEFFNFNFSDYKHENNIVFDVSNYDSIKNDLLKILGSRTIVDAKERIERLLINSGLQNKLTQVGAINISDIEVIKGRINHERLSNNPRSLSQKDIEKIIINIWE